MSQKKDIIVLEPGKRISQEILQTNPMICPYCGGRGFFTTDSLRSPDADQIINCPDCDGTGKVVATVTIDWKPNKKYEN